MESHDHLFAYYQNNCSHFNFNPSEIIGLMNTDKIRILTPTGEDQKNRESLRNRNESHGERVRSRK